MDINLLGIGAIMGATVVAGTNLYIFKQNRKKDELKERLENLYYPLNAIIEKKYKSVRLMKHHFAKDFESFAIAYYKFFLELRDTYLDNKIYESMELRQAFHLLDSYHRKEELNFCQSSSTEEELKKNLALFELKHQLDNDEMSELERNLESVIDVIRADILKLNRKI